MLRSRLKKWSVSVIAFAVSVLFCAATLRLLDSGFTEDFETAPKVSDIVRAEADVDFGGSQSARATLVERSTPKLGVLRQVSDVVLIAIPNSSPTALECAQLHTAAIKWSSSILPSDRAHAMLSREPFTTRIRWTEVVIIITLYGANYLYNVTLTRAKLLPKVTHGHTPSWMRHFVPHLRVIAAFALLATVVQHTGTGRLATIEQIPCEIRTVDQHDYWGWPLPIWYRSRTQITVQPVAGVDIAGSTPPLAAAAGVAIPNDPGRIHIWWWGAPLYVLKIGAFAFLGFLAVQKLFHRSHRNA